MLMSQFRHLWTPAQLSLAAWYDAGDSSTITESSGSVSQWDDKSGNGRNATQGTGSLQPTYTSSGIGSKYAISFDGGDRLNSSLSASSSAESIFVVGNITNNANNTMLGASADGGRQFRDNINTADLRFNRQFQAGLANSSPDGITRSAVGLMSLTYNSSTSTFYYNGEVYGTPTSVNPSLVSSRTTTIGCSGSGGGTEYLTGLMGEIVVCQSVLSTADRQKVEGYLAWKWGTVGSLGSSHPYKNHPPYA